MTVAVATVDELVPATRKQAEALEADIARGLDAVRRAWVYVAGRLYEFHERRAWEALGHKTWGAWLESPKVGISRSHADLLVRTWRTYVVGADVPADNLAGVDLQKVAIALPTVGREPARAQRVLADARQYTRQEMRRHYIPEEQHRADPAVKRCHNCGAIQ